MVRWPGQIKAGSTCDDLVNFSDLFPTLCELTSNPLPKVELHGRSFTPRLLGNPGQSRECLHIQHEAARQLRNNDYMLDNKNPLRRIVELWEEPAIPDENINPEKEAAARKSLQPGFDALDRLD